ncbi:MAG: hypothetical protein DI535_21195 [Citrobacter freundii]|nr:MAG: hypothetical protein DI535_21195 [Citrobacter freundii]
MLTQQPSERIESMDSLRGIASLQVVIGHALLIIPAFTVAVLGKEPVPGESFVNAVAFSPIHLVWAAHEAVILFFVMSGFVLAIPFYKKKKLQFGGFVVKRFFRIYVPYIAVLLLGWLCCTIFLNTPRDPRFSEWFNAIWARPVTSEDWFSFVTLQDSSFHNVVTSLWTLPIEIKASLLMPFIALAFDRIRSGFILLGIIVLNIILFKIGKKFGWHERYPEFKLFYYLTFFLMGASLSKFRAVIAGRLNNAGKPVLIILALLAACLYVFEWIRWILPANLPELAIRIIPADYAVAVSAVLLISLAVTNKGANLLQHKTLVKLGEISFSLYLLHPIVIGIVGYTIGPLVPFYVSIIISVVLSAVIALPFSKFVEVPVQNLGRRLSAKINGK